MSEFIEIDGSVYRKDRIEEVCSLTHGGASIVLANGSEVISDEPYESIRDKLLGKTTPVVDQRKKLVEHLVAIFRNDGLHEVADRIEVFYHSAMLSEMEGAG